MNDAVKSQQQVDRDIERIQKEQRKNAKEYTDDINNQVNGDLEAQLKNLYDHLPKDHSEKMKKQEAAIKKKGMEIEKEGDDQASKIKSQTDKIIGENGGNAL